MKQNITIVGHVGRDREIRYTKVWTRTVRERVVEDEDHFYTVPEHTVENGGNEFVVLSVAVNRNVRGGTRTEWHRVVAWNTDRCARHPARLCYKGDKVRIKGFIDEFQTVDGTTIQQIVVEDLELLKVKTRRQYD